MRQDSRAERGQRRFDDVRLGQRLDPVAADGAASVAEAACRLVLAWSGSQHADLVSYRPELSEPCGGPLVGKVIARHMDGSRQVAIEVCAAGASTRAVVQVALT